MGLGIVGFDLDRVFGALIGGFEVSSIFVELRYVQVFGDALVVGLEILDLGEFAAGGSGVGCVGGFRGGGVSGSAFGLPSLELLLELELLLLLLESGYIGGGDWVGNGCSSAAVECGFVGVGTSGVSLDGRGFAGSPGNGNCWAAGGCFWSAEGAQGLSFAGLPEVWLADGHGGVSAGFWVGAVWAIQAAESTTTASTRRDTTRIVE